MLNLQLFQEELARRRFFREARSAASVRHPNVASVYHLGSREREIFYAMEFLEGETLESLIKRSGRIEPMLALEIAGQVASGLAAIHQQNLVHRDIKPGNIMVHLKGASVGTVKIIDLGLAKVVNESHSQTAISIPGAFAGTPEFASPEQLAGSRRGYPFGSVFVGRDALDNADRPSTISLAPRRGHVSASARALTARTIEGSAAARHRST